MKIVYIKESLSPSYPGGYDDLGSGIDLTNHIKI